MSTQTGGAQADTLGRRGRPLRTIDCVAQSLAAGPIFSAAVVGAALAGLSGGVGPFVILVTFVGVLGLGYVVSSYARRYSGSGTVYEFIAHGLGKRPAVWSAGAYHAAALTLGGPTVVVFIGLAADSFFAAHLDLHMAWWIWALIAQGLILAANQLGVQVSVKTQLTIVSLSVIPFLVLAMAIVIDGGTSGNTLSVFDPANVAEGGSVFKGLLFAILIFVGFELSAALGEETENPQRSIPRAVLSTIVLVAAFYVITQYVGTIGSGGPDMLPFDFATLGDAYVGDALGIMIELAILLDMCAVAIGFQSASGRGLFTLARDGLLPRALATTTRWAVPGVALFVVGAVSVVGVLAAAIAYGTGPETPVPFEKEAFNAFLIGSVIGGMLISAIYFILCLGGLGIGAAARSPLLIGCALLGLATGGGGVAAQFISGTEPVGDAVWGRTTGLVIAGLLLLWLAWLIVRRRQAIQTVGSRTIVHDETAKRREAKEPALQ